MAGSYVKRVCPICGADYHYWINCNRPDCHDGRMLPHFVKISLQPGYPSQRSRVNWYFIGFMLVNGVAWALALHWLGII